MCNGRWNGARCPELVAGLGKQVEVVMWSNDVQEVSTIGHVVVVGSPYHMYPPPKWRRPRRLAKKKNTKHKEKENQLRGK